MIFDGIEAFRASGLAPRIGIIGAGPAGISIAHKLGKAKIPSVIFEAGRQRLQRRIAGFLQGQGDRRFLFRPRCHAGCAFSAAARTTGPAGAASSKRMISCPSRMCRIAAGRSRGRRSSRSCPKRSTSSASSLSGRTCRSPPRCSWFDLIKSDHVHFGEKFRRSSTSNPNVAVVLNTEVSAARRAMAAWLPAPGCWSQGAPAGEIALDYFVVCTGGLENSRLLLWSNEQSNGGVVPNAAALGRYWMEHPMYTAGDAIITNDGRLRLGRRRPRLLRRRRPRPWPSAASSISTSRSRRIPIPASRATSPISPA